jgi:hypothetical protein
VDGADWKAYSLSGEVTQKVPPFHHTTVMFASNCVFQEIFTLPFVRTVVSFEDEEECPFQMKTIPPKTPRLVIQIARMSSTASLLSFVLVYGLKQRMYPRGKRKVFTGSRGYNSLK